MAHHKHQRSRWTGTQLSLILLLMASTASISAFYLGSYAHNMLLIMHQPIDQHTTKTGLHTSHNKGSTRGFKLSSTKPSSEKVCHVEEHAEYEGAEVIKWGAENMQETPGGCCNDCKNTPGCNVWVYCPNPNGCGMGRKHRECWLKKQAGLNPLEIKGYKNPAHPWTSGAMFSEAEVQALKDAEQARMDKLRGDEELPLVFLDVAIKNKFVGRMVFALFTRTSPRSAENFRQLCTGEKGVAPGNSSEGAGQPFHFKGKAFYRILDRFIDQTGAGTDSVYGGMFKDDPGGLKLKHDRKGLLSMANMGPDTNTSHFSIMMGPAPHLNGHYTIFGELVEGWVVAEAINKLSRGKKDNFAGEAEGAVIVDSGQLRRGKPLTEAQLQLATSVIIRHRH